MTALPGATTQRPQLPPTFPVAPVARTWCSGSLTALRHPQAAAGSQAKARASLRGRCHRRTPGRGSRVWLPLLQRAPWLWGPLRPPLYLPRPRGQRQPSSRRALCAGEYAGLPSGHRRAAAEASPAGGWQSSPRPARCLLNQDLSYPPRLSPRVLFVALFAVMRGFSCL